MKTLFFPAKSTLQIDEKEISKLSKDLPKIFAICYSIQYKEIAENIELPSFNQSAYLATVNQNDTVVVYESDIQSYLDTIFANRNSYVPIYPLHHKTLSLFLTSLEKNGGKYYVAWMLDTI